MGLGRWMAWTGGAAAVAVASFACRQLVGIGDEPPPGPAAEAGFTYGQGECASCVATSCGPQAMACAGSPSCATLEGCLSGCTDPTCRAECGVDHGLGNDGATPAFEACLAGSCGTACGLVCGGLAAVFPPATAPACEQCIAGASVCSSVRECATSVQCQTSLRCRFSSDTADVQQACGPLGPDAGAVPLTITASENPPIAASCAKDCSWGADWSCLGRVDLPPPTNAVAVTVDVFNLNTGSPIDDATVKVCGIFDSYCMNAVQTGNTGDSGTVPLSVDFGVDPQQIFLDITSPTTDPVLEFASAQLSQPRVTLPGATLPAMTLAALAQVAGVSFDPTLGVLAVSVHDCRLAPAFGVKMSSDSPGSTLVYNNGGVPLPAATATDAQGVAEFYNVATLPAYIKVTLTFPVSGHPQSPIGVFARPNEESILSAIPNQ